MLTIKSARHGLQRGFTLIEIMVVVIILGILVSLIAPNVFGVLDDAEVTATKVQLESIATSLSMYRMKNGRYPSTEEGLEALSKPPGGETPYLQSVPTDRWGNSYQYKMPGERGDFDLFSYGRDGQAGGEDLDADIGNWQGD